MFNAKATLLILTSLLLHCNTRALTIGPVTETKIILVEPGNPVQVVEDKSITVKVKVVGSDAPAAKITKNIGGWLLVTRWDWDAYAARLKRLAWIEKNYPDIADKAKQAASPPPEIIRKLNDMVVGMGK